MRFPVKPVSRSFGRHRKISDRMPVEARGLLLGIARLGNVGPLFSQIFAMSVIMKQPADYCPAMVISASFTVGQATRPRNTKSVPIVSMLAYIFLRLPAMVISSTG
jgi:hypothetical protein